MDADEKKALLRSFSDWWRQELAVAHKENTVKLTSVKKFNINPFLWSYLAYFLDGKDDARSLARVLIYPRALGTSITTSFGTRFQQFVTRYFKETYGSPIPGIDIEFTDKVDGRKKYCQLKSGPNVINYDDVTTIKNHFRDAIRRARTNSSTVRVDDYVFCLIYGEEWEKSQFIKSIEDDYPVVMGNEFWRRFTGDESFYADLIDAIGQIANEFDMKDTVEQVIDKLAGDIQKQYKDIESN